LIICGHDKYSITHGPQALSIVSLQHSNMPMRGPKWGIFLTVSEVEQLICLRQAVLVLAGRTACPPSAGRFGSDWANSLSAFGRPFFVPSKTQGWLCSVREAGRPTKRPGTSPGHFEILNDTAYSASADFSAASWSTLARGALPSSNSLAWTIHSSRSMRPPSDSLAS